MGGKKVLKGESCGGIMSRRKCPIAVWESAAGDWRTKAGVACWYIEHVRLRSRPRRSGVFVRRSSIDRLLVVVVDVNSSSVAAAAALSYSLTARRDKTRLLSELYSINARPTICVLYSTRPQHSHTSRSGVVVTSPRHFPTPAAAVAYRLANRSNSVWFEAVLRRLIGSSWALNPNEQLNSRRPDARTGLAEAQRNTVSLRRLELVELPVPVPMRFTRMCCGEKLCQRLQQNRRTEKVLVNVKSEFIWQSLFHYN